MAASGVQCLKGTERRMWEDRPRTSLNGGELVRSTFVVLTFARALASVASFILVFVFAFLSPFGSEIFAFLFCNGEKRGIWSQCWIISCGTFGGVFAHAHGGLWRRVTFHRSSRKAGVNCARRRRWGGRRCCWGGWLTLWWARGHANGLWAVQRRSTTMSSIRNTRRRRRSIAHGGRSERVRLQWSTDPWRGGAICSSFRLPVSSHHPSPQLWLSLLAWSVTHWTIKVTRNWFL